MDTPAPFPVPPEAVLNVCLCHATRRTARAVSRVYDAALAPLGLKSGQFALLAAVGAYGPVSIARLGETMLMEASTLSRNLAPLRRAGLLTSEGAGGRRAGTLELAGQGVQLLGKAVTAWQAVQGTLSQKLGGSAAGSLLQLLDRAAGASL